MVCGCCKEEEGARDMTINQRLRGEFHARESHDFTWNPCDKYFAIYRLQIYEYSQQMDENVEKEISCDVTLKIIDMMLLNETSLNKPAVRCH